MKKINGIEIANNSTPEVDNEFIFSTGEKMTFKVGKLSEKQVSATVNRLVNHARYLVKNSSSGTILPANLKTQIKEQVEELNSYGFIFRYYLRVGSNIVSWNDLCNLANPYETFNNLFIPGTESNSYTMEELDGFDHGLSVLAMFQNAESSFYDASLMLQDYPWDEKVRYISNKSNITKKQAIKEFLKAQPFDGIEVSQTSHRDATSMYIMDRNDKIPADKMFLSCGDMLTRLGRRDVRGYSYVGTMSSIIGNWFLRAIDGDTFPVNGVGFSAQLLD